MKLTSLELTSLQSSLLEISRFRNLQSMEAGQGPSHPAVGPDGEVPKLSNWRYNSPLVQVAGLGLVCFCLPGMFSALNGLGAAGKADATIADNALTALSVSFAICSLLAGAMFNIVGHRVLLLVGGLTYALYVGSYLSYNPAFVITAGAVLGVGAGFLWAAQGAIMVSYPEEDNKGKFISMFWSIFNTGAVLGSLIPLIIEWNSGKSSVSIQTYIAFMVVMVLGSILSLALLPPEMVIRSDGKPVAIHRYSSWTSEAVAVAKLFLDWRMIALSPMFLASNWFYTYQFNAVNGGGLFTTRTRAFNGTLYWTAQILGSMLMGHFLDSSRFVSTSRRVRGLLGLTLLLIVSSVIWGGGLGFQLTFTRSSAKAETDKMDFEDSSEFAGPVTLFALYGLFDAFWQTYSYWIMGALTNDTREAARFVGFYKAVQNAGAASAYQIDANRVSFLVQLIVNWALLTLGCFSAYLVALSVKDIDVEAFVADSGGLQIIVPNAGMGETSLVTIEHTEVSMPVQFEPENPIHKQR